MGDRGFGGGAGLDRDLAPCLRRPPNFRARLDVGRIGCGPGYAARQKLRGAIEKKCSDAAVEALAACGSTLDALADATGAAGCLLDSIDGSVDDVLFDELGL